MARTLLVAGTASHVGKSTVAAGLCRALSDRGIRVAPFKAQNMSNNARAVPRATEPTEAGEIGVSQYVQARAARIEATTDVNPVLLKPRGDGESQLVIDGEAVGNVAAGEYYEDGWERAREAAREAHARLAAEYDVIVAEGAGSIAEINLADRDLANVETVRFADRVAPGGRPDGRAAGPRDAEILLLCDIERGGAFASLYGTLELMPEDCRERVVGAAITKFRGDRSLLKPGIAEIEERTDVPVLGVLPYDDPGLPTEDSVSLPAVGETAVYGDSEGVRIAVPRLSRISNFTDLEPLAREPGVGVVYGPPESVLDGADAVVLPGTKNTVDDLLELHGADFGDRLDDFSGPIVGLCGGYQMLGERITNAAIEGTGDEGVIEGFGLLPVETRFSPEKRVERVERDLRGVGPLAGARGRVSGYEIHMGESRLTGPTERPFEGEGAATDGVLGTYLHGLFENRTAREAFLDRVFEGARRERPDTAERASPYDRAATLVTDHLALDALGIVEDVSAVG
ncbi:cobyric acid synthase [Halalkalicoccus sp. NIPERK01]|uniref:cobyric acid synthase n=1 Tax=Halalkalicoccus sp. NIPERK01 TaxID=3053469 RepID=UPI00256F00A8|nr:cobyric acid synthase [Halalkalicoccus sp. NIPERK01]MDL5361669.1 cobyric acid synthase [Halalkalicoccus sp. NIPERK01]